MQVASTVTVHASAALEHRGLALVFAFAVGCSGPSASSPMPEDAGPETDAPADVGGDSGDGGDAIVDRDAAAPTELAAVVERGFARLVRLRERDGRGEPGDARCRLEAGPGDTEMQPFAITSFTLDGVREGTTLFRPDAVDELVVFDVAARGATSTRWRSRSSISA